MEYPYKDAEEYIAGVFSEKPRPTPKGLAWYLKVHNTHVYRARKGHITPTLRRAIADRGYIPPPPPRHRHRRAAEFTPDRARQFDEMLAERDITLSEWMNEELDRWLTR